MAAFFHQILARLRALHWGTASLAVMALMAPNLLASELFSESVQVPPVTPSYLGDPVTGWHGFNILLSDSPTLPAQNAADPDTDPFAVNGTSTITIGPFAAAATDAGIPVGPGFVTQTGLTRVHYAGTVDINPANIPDQGLSNPAGQVQFGLVGPVDNTPLHLLAQHWVGSYADAAAQQSFNYLRGVPVVSISPNPAPPPSAPSGTNFNYIVDFIQFTQDGISGTEWAEFPFVPGSQPVFNYGGWADPVDSIHFTNHETQISPTLIPLDDLNFADDPLAGGVNGPAFTSAAIPADVVPEPCAPILLLAAASSLFLRQRSQLA